MGMFEALLILNALWFFAGFHLFYLRRHVFAKILVPKQDRDTPVLATLTATGRFMGGFNFAFMVLNLLLLFNLSAFDSDHQRAILLTVMAVAHGSQFVGNLPIALENRHGRGVWNVLGGLMLFIFITDITLMLLNAALAIMLWM